MDNYIKIGNTDCVASGGAPHRCDIMVVNNTQYDLELDRSAKCQRECGHTGWRLTDGKIVKGCEPPSIIRANSRGEFAVSGREASAVAPKGKVYYKSLDKEQNLKVTFHWDASGWTSLTKNKADVTIEGTAPRGWFGGGENWSDLLRADCECAPWIFTLRPYNGRVDEAGRELKGLSKKIQGIPYI